MTTPYHTTEMYAVTRIIDQAMNGLIAKGKTPGEVALSPALYGHLCALYNVAELGTYRGVPLRQSDTPGIIAIVTAKA